MIPASESTGLLSAESQRKYVACFVSYAVVRRGEVCGKIWRCSACLSTFEIPVHGEIHANCPHCDAVLAGVRE